MPTQTDNFELDFFLCPCNAMDNHALLATQKYNLGDRGSWFYTFRKGLIGFHSRIYGFREHYHQVHAWQPRPRHHREPEYHLATIFFHMDSALECFTYALNALGYGFTPDKFVDITDEKSLRSIGPANIIGTNSKSPIPGYGELFPNLQLLWKENKGLIDQITELHDVSKHRSAIYEGGRGRNDPPPGFYEALGVPNDPGARMDFAPMAEIILPPDPKLPHPSRTRIDRYEDLDTLESLGARFCNFINGSVEAAARDAIFNINIPHRAFLPRAIRVVASDVPLFEDSLCEIKRGDAVGVIVGHESVGFGITSTSIHPTTKAGLYVQGALLDTNEKSGKSERSWGATWYIDPADGEIKQAWSSSLEYRHAPANAS